MAQKALLVGINKYPNPKNNLNGCVNDIKDMANFLIKNSGFVTNDIRLLTDERATAREIKDRLSWLISDVKEGDRILFHYSGHGAMFPIRNGSGKVDKIYECICPYDFNWTSSTCIRDIDFADIFGAIPAGVDFVWVSDSCHSGGLVDTKGFIAPGTPVRLSKRFHTPEDIQWRLITAKAEQITEHSFREVARTLTELNAVLVAACRADQTASDAYFGSKPNGALTHFLLKCLEDTTTANQPLSSIVVKILTLLQSENFDQEPQLEGNVDLKEKAFLKSRQAK